MHAYALLKTPETALALPEGINGPLELLRNGHLSAVIEPGLKVETLQDDDEALLLAILGHDRIIQYLFQQTTVLPLRFASFPSLAALLAKLTTHQAHYLEQLTEFAGKAEYWLKLRPIAYAETAIPPTLRGKAYFLAKKQQHLAQEQYSQQQQENLESIMQAIARDYPLQPSNDPHQVYVLLDQTQLPELQHAIAHFNQHYPTWDIHLGDALPPFHFV